MKRQREEPQHIWILCAYPCTQRSTSQALTQMKAWLEMRQNCLVVGVPNSIVQDAYLRHGLNPIYCFGNDAQIAHHLLSLLIPLLGALGGYASSPWNMIIESGLEPTQFVSIFHALKALPIRLILVSNANGVRHPRIRDMMDIIYS